MEYELHFGQAHLKVISDGSSKATAVGALVENYGHLVDYINSEPVFKSAYEPVDVPSDAPPIIAIMAEAGRAAGVGPMAAVAGTIANMVGQALVDDGAEDVSVENGGDIYIRASEKRTIGLFAGQLNLANRLAFEIEPEYTPVCICTSSSSVGHSVSLGDADSVTVFSTSGALADACATACANRILGPEDIEEAIDIFLDIDGVRGIFISAFGMVGARGELPHIKKA